MSPSANHKPRLSMWGMLLTLAQLPPNANNCNVLATIKRSTQTLYVHTQMHVQKDTHILVKAATTHMGEFPNQEF